MKLSYIYTPLVLLAISVNLVSATDFGNWNAPESNSESHIGYSTWHSPDGRTISAMPVNVIGKNVIIRLSDGREMTVSPNIFTPEDKERITNWAIRKLAERDALLEISASRIKKKIDTIKQVSMKIEKFEAYYDVTYENRSDFDIEALTADYVLYIEEEVAGRADVEPLIKKEKGTTKITLAARDEATELTNRIAMQETELESNYVWTSGADDKSEAKLIGIWLRVYHNGILVKEYVNPSRLQKDFKWEH